MKKRIVIVGGGFAGIELIRALKNRADLDILLIDKNNYNFFPPLLYQVATGFLDVSNISYPYRIFLHRYKNCRFRMAELLEVNPETNEIELSNGKIGYDYLILATGTTTNFFGMEAIRANSLPMKTVNDALELRNFLLSKIEESTRIENDEERQKNLTIVVAGGGPTGVEVAGMLAEMRLYIFEKDYPELQTDHFQIHLIDGANAVLATMSKKAQKYTYESLTGMGVQVHLNAPVVDYYDESVHIEGHEPIRSRILIWAAGVTGQVFKGIPEESYGPGRRLQVDAFNKVNTTSNIYAIGDNCLQLTDPSFPKGHPQMAQIAIQQGRNLAKNLIAQFENREQKPFVYKDKGAMAIIGRNKAAADIPKPKLHFTGWLAWMLWLFVHLFSMISYRNRIKTMYNWTTAYFTKNQSMRMIIRPFNRKK